MFNKFGLLTILLPYYGFFEDWQDLLSQLSKGHYKTFKDFKKEFVYLEGSMDQSKKLPGFEKFIRNKDYKFVEMAEFRDIGSKPITKSAKKHQKEENLLVWDGKFGLERKYDLSGKPIRKVQKLSLYGNRLDNFVEIIQNECQFWINNLKVSTGFSSLFAFKPISIPSLKEILKVVMVSVTFDSVSFSEEETLSYVLKQLLSLKSITFKE